jgi:hypothetical protein
MQTVQIYFDKETDQFYFEGNSSYKAKEFIFGSININNEPFNNNQIFTAIGQITSIKRNKIYFVSNLLNKTKTTLRIIKY